MAKIGNHPDVPLTPDPLSHSWERGRSITDLHREN
jgi:hypothetical protein